MIVTTPMYLFNYHNISFLPENLVTFTDKNKVFFILLVFMAIISRYFMEIKNFSLKVKNQKLEETINTYRGFLSGYIDALLKKLAEDLNHNESDRVTIFLYSATLDRFFSVGRYSSSPKFNKVGSLVIEDQKDYLYSVLNDEIIYDPLKSETFGENFKMKLKYLFKKRNMESKDIYGVPLYDNFKQNKIGVIVFQSMRKDRYKDEEFRKRVVEKSRELNLILTQMKIAPNSVIDYSKSLKGF
jgi:hypothetical protein